MAARRVSVADPAVVDFRRARQWLTQPGSGVIGHTRWRRLAAIIRTLRDHPYCGRASEIMTDQYMIVVSDHRVFYEVRPDTGDGRTAGDITIVAVLGPGRA